MFIKDGNSLEFCFSQPFQFKQIYQQHYMSDIMNCIKVKASFVDDFSLWMM